MATRGLISTEKKTTKSKSQTVMRFCNTHGDTEHYFYPAYSSTMCKQCARDSRKNRLKDPKIRKSELAYAKKWQANNKEKVKAHYQATQKAKLQEKKQKIDEFLAKESVYIDFILNKYNMPMTNVLRNYIGRMEKPNISEFIEVVRKRKYSDLKAHYTWNQSSYLKYVYNVRDNFKNAPQKIKEKIRVESQEFGIKEAEKILSELDRGLAVNKTIGKPKK